MRISYALAALALFCAPLAAEAQFDVANWPELTVNEPDNITFFNYSDDFPSPYVRPDTNIVVGPPRAPYYIGTSVFWEEVDSLTVLDWSIPVFDGTADIPGLGTVAGTVTGDVVLAEPILGCDTDNDGVPIMLDNADEIAGNIAMISRGSCNFTAKVISAEAAGAIGVLIYIPGPPAYLENQAAGNMGGGSTVPTFQEGFGVEVRTIKIPSFLVPIGIAQPLLDALEFDETVNVTMGCADVDPNGEENDCSLRLDEFNPVIPNAIGDIDLEQGVTAMKAYPNPTNGLARVALTTATPEVVRVEVYNTLGQRVAVLHDGMVNGQVDLDLDGSQFATGLYLVRATGETFRQTTRVTIAR